MALRFAGVRHDDMVITLAISFVATANAIVHCGAEPVFLRYFSIQTWAFSKFS